MLWPEEGMRNQEPHLGRKRPLTTPKNGADRFSHLGEAASCNFTPVPVKIEQSVKIPIPKRPLSAYRNFGLTNSILFAPPPPSPETTQKSNIGTLLGEAGFLSRFLSRPFVYLPASPSAVVSFNLVIFPRWVLGFGGRPFRTSSGTPRNATEPH